MSSGSHAAYQVSPDVTRIDLEFIPGDPIDVLIPILDCDDAPVEILDGDTAGWSARAVIRRHWAATRVLHEWSTTAPGNAVIDAGTPGGVRLTATGAETAIWQQEWPEFNAHWDLELTAPGWAGSQTIAGGRVLLRPEYTTN